MILAACCKSTPCTCFFFLFVSVSVSIFFFLPSFFGWKEIKEVLVGVT